MIKFKYRVNRRTKLIGWEATWDGKHTDKWYDKNSLVSIGDAGSDARSNHPFNTTVDFEAQERMYDDWMRRLRVGHRPYITIGKVGSVFEPMRLTRKEIEEHNPIHIRKLEDVVALNDVTLAMCRMLSSPHTIHRWCGWTERFWYWRNVLGALSRLWD